MAGEKVIWTNHYAERQKVSQKEMQAAWGSQEGKGQLSVGNQGSSPWTTLRECSHFSMAFAITNEVESGHLKMTF